MEIVPSDLWYRSRVLKIPLSHLAAEYGCSKNKIKLIVTSFRWKQGEVVMSRQWLLDRIRNGWTVMDIADRTWSSRSTIYKHIKQHGLIEVYKQHRPRGPGNPMLNKEE